jgi:hypothetical protein
VPSGAASKVVRTATRRDVHVALIQADEPKYSRYQRSDQLVGGNSRYWESENDIGITMTVGSIRKKSTSAP